MELSHYGTTSIQLIGEKRDFWNPSIKEFSSLRVSGVGCQVSDFRCQEDSLEQEVKENYFFPFALYFSATDNGPLTTDKSQHDNFTIRNPQLSFGLPPFGRDPSFAIRNYLVDSPGKTNYNSLSPTKPFYY